MLALSLAAAPLCVGSALWLGSTAAVGEVLYSGNLRPVAPPPPLNRPPATRGGVFDVDGDGNYDWIDSNGNLIRIDLVDPNNPAGTGTIPAWDDDIVWENYESRQNILVGETSYGYLEVNAASALRFMHIVLGGASTNTGGQLNTTANAAASTYNFQIDLGAPLASTGNGEITVTGFGSLLNNDPTSITDEAAAIVAIARGTFGTDPDMQAFLAGIPGARPQDIGFDLHVGLIGRGRLNVLESGRVEIQDALFVGLGDKASGEVNITGPGSYLTANGRTEFDPAGGLNSSRPAIEAASAIGGFGDGVLNITLGGSVDTWNGAGVGVLINNGSIIRPAGATTGGSGAVLIDGASSSWNVYPTFVNDAATGVNGNYALLIGGAKVADNSFTDPYLASERLGSGAVTVSNGGTLRVLFARGYTASNPTDANLAIGAQGELRLAGGRVVAENRIENDGELRGSGDVSSSTFYNRASGRITVGLGERLSILAAGADDFAAAGGSVNQLEGDDNNDGVVDGARPAFFQGNVGAINVTGGELVFGRVDTDSASNVERFRNARGVRVNTASTTAAPLVTEAVGTIVARDATLTFNSGLLNTGVISFSGGNNLLTGDVINAAPIDYDSRAAVTQEFIRDSVITIAGDETSATIAGNLQNDGTVYIGPDNNSLSILGDLTGSGIFDLTARSFLGDAGYVNVAGRANLNFASFALSLGNTASVTVGDYFDVLYAAGGISASAISADFSPTTQTQLGAGLQLGTTIVNNGTRLRLVVAPAGSGGGGGGAFLSFGDFNNDGIIDAADYTVWRDTLGSTTDLRADADGDGLISAFDREIWLLNYGVSFASTATALSTAIPEPTATVLLALGLAGLRRRR
jgi:hypothetical protein